MTRYLCLSVTFLNRMFHGRSDGGKPEWPPSPMRLYQALLAGARTGSYSGNWSDKKMDAFNWLEQRQPPLIVAPDVEQSYGYTFFVPDNVSDREFERSNRLVSKVAQANYLLNGDTVYFLWPLREESDLKRAEIICQEARHILALGWGIDQVVGNGIILEDNGVASLSGRRWRQWKNAFLSGARELRIPKSGSLKDLESVHHSFIHRLNSGTFTPPLKFSQFDRVIYLPQDSLPRRYFAEFELEDGISFPQEDVVKVAAMTRSLACRRAKSDTHSFPGGIETYVAGHAGAQDITPPRFSYMPIPSIGGEHSDGMIRRLLIAEPFGGDNSHAAWARRRLIGEMLLDDNGKERGRLLNPWRQTSSLMFKRYTGESSNWSTVTPVILPGHDGRSALKAEKLFLTAIRQAGLSIESISDINMRKAPFFPGSQHPRSYFLPDYIRARGWPGWHVHITFCEPFRGPLAIGAGRHIGLGIFAGSRI
jgi:CRISPR-associated protein Csb2